MSISRPERADRSTRGAEHRRLLSATLVESYTGLRLTEGAQPWPAMVWKRYEQAELALLGLQVSVQRICS